MDESAVLAEKLQSEGERMIHFLTGLNEHEWSTEVYTEGTTWTVRSIAAHLMSAERAFLQVFDQIQHGGHGVSADFVIDRYNASQQRKTRDMNRQQLIEEFSAARQRMIAFVRGLTGEDLEQRGRHPYLGETTLRDMVKMIYIHNQTHLRDIRRALGPD